MNYRSLVILTIFLLTFQSLYSQKSLIWKNEIDAFAQRDSLEMPHSGAIVFVGSSSIRGWRSVEKDFSEYTVINRGFGGAEIADVIYYFQQVIGRYKPKQVFLYAGDNDIAAGRSAIEVFADFKSLARLMRKELSHTELIYLSIKPSLARWSMFSEMQKANQQIRRYARWHKHVGFVDVATPMLGEDGQPENELFIGDGLHMTPQGYDLWGKLVRPYLKN